MYFNTRFAYEKWDIVLCALYCTEPEKPSIIINPAIYRDLNINSLNMKAIVIATNSIVVNRYVLSLKILVVWLGAKRFDNICLL